MTLPIADGPVPKHEQLRSLLESRIAAEFSPGDPLPGERALEEEYGVSRITVRRAIGDLVAEGRLRRVRGKGTFVAPAPLVSRLHLASFSDEMRAQRVEASSRILLCERTTPSEEVAQFFGTAPTATHIRLRRLRLGDGEPYAVDDAWYNATLVPDPFGKRRLPLRVHPAGQALRPGGHGSGADSHRGHGRPRQLPVA